MLALHGLHCAELLVGRASVSGIVRGRATLVSTLGNCAIAAVRPQPQAISAIGQFASRFKLTARDKL
jgi:hypothetical protein